MILLGRHAKDKSDKALVIAVSIMDSKLKDLIEAWRKDGSIIISKKFEHALLHTYLKK